MTAPSTRGRGRCSITTPAAPASRWCCCKYPGEGHGLSKKENQIDYERRILQWFGYYLKGEPAAPWITNGQTAVERKAILDANKPSPLE